MFNEQLQVIYKPILTAEKNKEYWQGFGDFGDISQVIKHHRLEELLEIKEALRKELGVDHHPEGHRNVSAGLYDQSWHTALKVVKERIEFLNTADVTSFLEKNNDL